MGATSIDEVLDLFTRFGDDTYGEAVTQLDHALQTAALARAEGADDALVAAALLHDVGHLLDLQDGGVPDTEGRGDLAHEARGARWLAPLLPPSVTGPIALHVAAKRYRCAVDPLYNELLSDASRASLEVQGGPMDEVEVARFEAHPAFEEAVALRIWDDGGKVAEPPVVQPLDTYVPLLKGLATGSRT